MCPWEKVCDRFSQLLLGWNLVSAVPVHCMSSFNQQDVVRSSCRMFMALISVPCVGKQSLATWGQGTLALSTLLHRAKPFVLGFGLSLGIWPSVLCASYEVISKCFLLNILRTLWETEEPTSSQNYAWCYVCWGNFIHIVLHMLEAQSNQSLITNPHRIL